jgi:plastocyanin
MMTRSRNLRVFFPAALVLVGAGAVIFALPNENPSPIDTTPISGETIVRMTEDGFVPSELFITVGTTVRFVNEDEYWHWPASDLHPTHGVYAAFDSRKGIAPGAEWAFTFDQAGTWGMHDHLIPYVVGSITVVEEE